MRTIFRLLACLVLSLGLKAETAPLKTKSFQPFAGQVSARKVRLRASADLDGPIIAQLAKGHLLLVVGEKADFYAVKPPENYKLYVFRSYIVDNIVEAHRVNLRLKPALDAPVVGRLSHKEKINGQICPNNPKWYEVVPPENCYLYVAKEYVAKAGDENYYWAKTRKQETNNRSLETALETASFVSPPSETVQEPLITSIELPKTNENTVENETGFAEITTDSTSQEAADQTIAESEKLPIKPEIRLEDLDQKGASVKMKEWLPAEYELFTSWTTFHPEKSIDDFYNEQMASALEIQGVLEKFPEEINNKPGDYLVKGESLPQAYLYSTRIDLSAYVGQKVTLKVTPRPNNNFAFPAYFVFEVKTN
ncbi:MAG: SH3 domain-containing protein [Parachlamydiales bacterium]|jgi:hypothetical protein